jgi:Flp pilus assembly protein TadD
LNGLPPRAINALRQLQRNLDSGDVVAAERTLPAALLLAPGHREMLRLASLVHRRRGQLEDAEHYLREALATAPEDLELRHELCNVLSERGQAAAAIEGLRDVCRLHPSASVWLDLGIALDRVARVAESLDAADEARKLGSSDPRIGFLRARCLQMLGHVEAAAEQYRELIRMKQEIAKAWFALIDMKTISIDDSEVRALRAFAAGAQRSEEEKLLLDFALARICENSGARDEAFQLLSRANAQAKRRFGWNADAHCRYVDSVDCAFANVLPVTRDVDRGREVIFIVGFPRSGSTLVEQVLAAHPEVEGASELPDLSVVISNESAARRKHFPDWVSDASAEDWARLGQDYLARTASWRRDRPIFTDKAPDNWKYVGAIAAMLPGARVIDCRRDPLETCWSCYKQLFAPGQAGFAYSLEDLADYWKDYVYLSARWSAMLPKRFRLQSYEAFLADSAGQIRDLLEFCDLPFDGRCLQPHEAGRAIRTTSSAQVREPLRRDTVRAAEYGQLLDPFRERLSQSRLVPAARSRVNVLTRT